MFSTFFQTLCALDTTYPGDWIQEERTNEQKRKNKELETMYRHTRLTMWMERSSDEDVLLAGEVLKGALRGWMERKTLKNADLDISSFVETSDVSSELVLDQLREVVARVELLEEDNRMLRTALKEKSVQMEYEQHQHLLAEIHLRGKKKVDLFPIGLDSKLI